MKILLRNTSLDGKPFEGDGEVFTGERPLDVVMAMKGAALFSDCGSVTDYVDMVLRNAKMLAGIELTVSGDTPEALAESLLAVLLEHELAEVLEDRPVAPSERPAPVPIPERVYRVIDSIRRSGITNMLDRSMVQRLAREMGFEKEAAWIEANKKQYAEGLFRGFLPVAERRGR